VIKATPDIIESIFQEKGIGERDIAFVEKSPGIWRSFFSMRWILASFLASCVLLVSLLFLWGKESMYWSLPFLAISVISGVLKRRRFSGLVLEKGGISYRSDDFAIFVPWGNLDRQNPVAISPEGFLCFTLLSIVPGKGYMVKAAHFETRDMTDDPPFELEGRSLFLRKRLAVEEEVVQKITSWWLEQFCIGILKKMPVRESDYPVILEKSYLDQNIVRIKERAKRSFPSFCPVSGKECDQIRALGEETEEPIMWMFSSSGVRYQGVQEVVRLFSCFIALSLYLLRGYSIFYSGENANGYRVINILFQSMMGMGVFIILPVVWYLTRDKIVAYDRDPIARTVSIKVEDEDYFIAFVDLNVAPEHPLPWRIDPDE
jgi:hypothetical protein